MVVLLLVGLAIGYVAKRPSTHRAEARSALEELNQFSETILVVAVTDEAARICKKSVERGLARGKPRVQIVASSLYAACREKEIPLTLANVAATCGVDRITVASCYRLLVENRSRIFRLTRRIPWRR